MYGFYGVRKFLQTALSFCVGPKLYTCVRIKHVRIPPCLIILSCSKVPVRASVIIFDGNCSRPKSPCVSCAALIAPDNSSNTAGGAMPPTTLLLLPFGCKPPPSCLRYSCSLLLPVPFRRATLNVVASRGPHSRWLAP